MNFKVYNGTGPDLHLCRSCCASMVRIERSQEVTICRELPGQHPYIQGKVTECSAYTSISESSAMRQYRGLAWLLDNDEEGLTWRTPADQHPGMVRSYRRKNPRRAVTSSPGPTVQ